MWSQLRTPRKNQSNPTAVTPDIRGTDLIERSIDNNNHYSILANDESSHTSINSETTDNSSDSTSTMSSTAEDSCLISLETLKSKMETIEPGITTINSNPKYTDVVIFQETMGNAVAELAVEYQTYGFSYLVDTTKRFKQRHPAGTEQEPMDMPKPPVAPTREERSSTTIKRYRYNLIEYKQAIHMKTIGLALLTDTFPNCLDLKETDFGYPSDFHLKDALAYVLDNTTCSSEQDKEFQGFQRDLLNLHYRHDPKSNSIDKFFKSIQRLKKKQDLVASHPGAGQTYIQLISNAQTQVYEGVGGRKDLVHELKEKWNTKQVELTNAGTAHDQIWELFKAHYKKELHKLDLQGFTTKKINESASARSIIPPEQVTVNSNVEHRLSGITNQLDALTEQTAQVASAAMSAISTNQRAFNASGVPTYIQTDPTNGNASAIGSDTITEAQCRRLLNEQQINMGKQMDAMMLKNQELLAKIRNLELQNNSTIASTAANTSYSGSQHRSQNQSYNHNQDQRTSVKDTQGRKWYQVKFYCSKHGFNTSHSNENCNSKHLNRGHPWVPGATPSNTKGGSNALADKFNHWYEPRAKQYQPQPPN